MAKRDSARIGTLDLARTAALAAMVVFHFTFDLMLFGHVPPGTVFTGFWPWFARGIAGSFLFLAGVSLWLAHGQGIRWTAFWRRFIRVAGAAALVTAATWSTMGDAYIRWGILHAIAAYSVIGLWFLRAPPVLTVLVAMACLFAPVYLSAEVFNMPWLLWLGLSTEIPPMMDYEPLLPWLAPLLLGVVAARAMAPVWPRLRGTPGPLMRALGWPGRHSLGVYLIHQPLLFGGVFLWTRFFAA